DERQDAQGQQNSAGSRQQIQAGPSSEGRIGINATRHSLESQVVHGKERQVGTDEHQPEVELAHLLAKHAAGELREPVIKRAEDRKDRTADQDVVEMRDHEVSVVNLKVERH